MSSVTNHLPTAELQALNAAHHMRPFTTGDELAAKGARVITRAKGVYLTDSEGNEILSIMFEMKNEMETTAVKKKNSDFFKKLDKIFSLF